MEHLSSEMEQQQIQQIEWRRDKVQELCSKGYSQREISQILQVGLATVNRDISYLRNQAKTNIKKYIDERLPEELLTNATVVDDAIRFVSDKLKEKPKLSSEGDNEESNEPDYREDQDQLEEEQEEKETGEITTNQVF
jgi:predicted transcriptional regulator